MKTTPIPIQSTHGSQPHVAAREDRPDDRARRRDRAEVLAEEVEAGRRDEVDAVLPRPRGGRPPWSSPSRGRSIRP